MTVYVVMFALAVAGGACGYLLGMAVESVFRMVRKQFRRRKSKLRLYLCPCCGALRYIPED